MDIIVAITYNAIHNVVPLGLQMPNSDLLHIHPVLYSFPYDRIANGDVCNFGQSSYQGIVLLPLWLANVGIC